MSKHIPIGSRVRSFDFAPHNRETEGEHACFVEGVVTGIKKTEGFCDRFVIKVERRVFAGEESTDLGWEAFPPVNGTPSLFSGPTNGVEVINAK